MFERYTLISDVIIILRHLVLSLIKYYVSIILIISSGFRVLAMLKHLVALACAHLLLYAGSPSYAAVSFASLKDNHPVLETLTWTTRNAAEGE